MQPQLQRIEVQPLRRRDDDLTVDHAAGGNAFEKRVVQLGKVPVEGSKIAALDVDIGCRAEDDRAESIPLRLVEELPFGRQIIRELGQHRLDRRLDGSTHCRTV